MTTSACLVFFISVSLQCKRFFNIRRTSSPSNPVYCLIDTNERENPIGFGKERAKKGPLGLIFLHKAPRCTYGQLEMEFH